MSLPFPLASMPELWGVLEYLDAHPLEYATLRRQVISTIIGMLIQEKEITNVV